MIINILNSILIGIFLISNPANCEQYNLNLLETNGSSVETRENIVDIGGLQYREIQVQGNIYYVRFLANIDANPKLEMYCKENGELPKGAHHLEVKSVTKRRSRLFIRFLETQCVERLGRYSVALSPALNFGIEFMSDKDHPNSTKIFWNPLSNRLGGSVEF